MTPLMWLFLNKNTDSDQNWCQISFIKFKLSQLKSVVHIQVEILF